MGTRVGQQMDQKVSREEGHQGAWSLPDNGTESQHHFEVMNQQNIESILEDRFVASGGHVLQEAARVDEQSKSTKQDIEGLLVARVWTIDPPEAKDTEDKGGQNW